MGYGSAQIRELEQTIRATDCDLVLVATPIDLAGLLVIEQPAIHVRYEMDRPAQDALRVTFGRKGDAGGDFAMPKGVAFDEEGRIWVCDAQFENIQGFDRTGRLLLSFGREGLGPGEFWLPSGLAIDSRRRLWVADTYNRRIQVFRILP